MVESVDLVDLVELWNSWEERGEWAGRLPERVDLIYTFEMNEYNGRKSLQLKGKDIKAAG